ncbi:FAD/NAD(P)-binding domain-containing protein [Ramaria rubella]|nr:FAD/NAD(P)-binding domain-containing protein [Ramaria rubella]
MPAESKSTKYSEILCIGFGLSGICLGVQLQRKFGFTDIHFYDRNPNPSGTWWANRYPGCACDIQAIFYSFSFEPNPNWSRLLPSNVEIRQYVDSVIEKYNLRSRVTLLTECESAEWDDSRQIWTVYLRNLETGEKHIHNCRLLFSGVGILVEPKEPDIPGKETFEGPLFHTARWIDGVDLKDKNVVVLGNGCSASQMVPIITPLTKSLTQFIRTPHWLLERENTVYSPTMSWAYRNIPLLARLKRLKIFLDLEFDEYKLFLSNKIGIRKRRETEKESMEFIYKTAPKKYHDMLIPNYEIACKRRVFDADSAYLKSLHAPNLLLTKDPVLEILPHGVRTGKKTYHADVVIMATGFKTNNGLGPLRIRGREGEWLNDRWKKQGGPGAYNSTAVHGFPNFMMIFGPNSATGYSSVLLAIENMVNYSLKIAEPIIQGRATAVEVKEHPEKAYLARLQAACAGKVWDGACNNWYVTSTGWNSTMYPWSQFYFWWRCEFPIRRDWTYSVCTIDF